MSDFSQDRLIVECLESAVSELVAVYRFGSTTHGVTTTSSDVDIAVLASGRIDAAAWFDLQERLSLTVACAVDLLDLSTASPVLAVQVLSRGRLLYEGEAAARGQFEDEALMAYARLNEDRREILARVAAEGTVYGR